MIGKIKKAISKHLYNIPGWKTSRRIVVIESDDWGSIRMPSKQVFDELLAQGINVDKCEFCSNDSLATADDLKALFAVLEKHRDKNGNPAVITANTIVANPDFAKIRAADFREYHYEEFTETLKANPGQENIFDTWKEGMQKNVFHPQLHGREHLNVNRWMNFLQNGSEETLMGFDKKMFGISTTITKEKRKSYMAAFDFDDKEELKSQADIVAEAQQIFTKVFGYPSKSFIAPNYTWSPGLELPLSDAGIKYLQGARMQIVPSADASGKKTIKHFTGQKNDCGQTYLVRNAYFEPSIRTGKNYVNVCLEQIESAFLWRNPAIIGSHRLNYISAIRPENRDVNLKFLDELLSAITKKWPDVEFMTSDKLGDLISNKK